MKKRLFSTNSTSPVQQLQQQKTKNFKFSDRVFESENEKSLLKLLFTTTTQTSMSSEKIKIINLKKSHSNAAGQFEWQIQEIQRISNLKLENNFAQIYAFLASGETDAAESIFHKAKRSNPNQVISMTSRPMIHAFISTLLARQKAEVKRAGSTFNNAWEVRAINWLDNMAIYGCAPTVHSFALFLAFYLDMGQRTSCVAMLEKLEKAWDGIVRDSTTTTTTSTSMGDQVAADSCFANQTRRILWNEFLVSTGRRPLEEYSESSNNIGDLLMSALEESVQQNTRQTKEQTDGDLKNIKLEAAETIGVNILLSILKSKESIAGMEKYNQQLWLESKALSAAQDQFQQEQKKMPKDLRKLSSLPPDLISNWHQALHQEIQATISSPSPKDESIIPFLKLVSVDMVCRIVISSILRVTPQKHQDEPKDRAITRFGQFSLIELAQNIGNSIQREHNLEQLNSKKNLKKLNLQKSIQKIHASGKLFNMAVRRAVLELERREDAKIDNWKPEWGMEVITIIGSYLIDKAIKVCLIPVQIPTDVSGHFNQEYIPSLQHTIEWKGGKKYGIIKLHSSLNELILSSSNFVAPWSLPMLVKPLPWLHARAGGYLQHRFSVVRTSFNREHDEYIKAADESEHLSTLLRSLDVLGSTGWNINDAVFRVAAYFWNNNETAPGIAAVPRIPAVPVPCDIETDVNVKKKYEKACAERDKVVSNCFSERCSTNYKLEIARAFLGETIYFPHNVDFRGRAYPIPPNLNHMGDDLCRGLLKFADKKPLGVRGMYWLKVQISNLFGVDKVPLEERVAFTDTHMDKVLDSAQNPIHGERWWLKADKPWQLLGACIELSEALKTKDPTEYLSGIPIHQDGSCNGLQHYAALGGDELGAAAVNLVPSDRPDDIYTKVAQQVQVLVDQEAGLGTPEAVLMKHRVNRKLVKQSVMTNTYGVTFIGARDQILNRLKEAREFETPETALTDAQMKKCASFAATLVFKSMDHMFEGARELQVWLTRAAGLVTKSVHVEAIDSKEIDFYNELLKRGVVLGEDVEDEKKEEGDVLELLMEAATRDTQTQASTLKVSPDAASASGEFDDVFEERKPVTIKKKKPSRMTSMIWTSPLGMPIVQPYRVESTAQVKTSLQSLTIPSQKASPVNSTKQASAFPPNFVHSLDASHMMLTSLACEAQKMQFAAVHDSYWTHARDVDAMGRVLRESFIRLHSQDIMGRLREELLARFSDSRVLREVEICGEMLPVVQEVAKKVGMAVRFNKRSRKMSVWVPFVLPRLPKKGVFDIQQVAKSTYFFH